MSEVDSNTINCIITSPPYYNKRNYVSGGGLGNEDSVQEYIDNLVSHLKDCYRVLKDDGTLLFCEHGIAPDKNIMKWQNRINPLWGKLFGGCNINRNIPEIIQSSGLKINKLEQMYLPSTPKVVAYNYWGSAQ